ncbi:MAG: Lrp/AsnC ligand binding domain-containing protein [Acidobacteria bacterium]|nr:Lrp/AsnC ligand binding domain-containing protein [Acidobacteriota bacterium]
MNYQIDTIDRHILRRLQEDSRTAYLEIARELGVAGGTIHARIHRLREAGVVRGARIVLDPMRLGYTVAAFIGIRLVHARSCGDVQAALARFPEIVEIHYTTGTYSLLIKVVVPEMRDLHALLFDKLQQLEEIQSTETFVILDTRVDRDLAL